MLTISESNSKNIGPKDNCQETTANDMNGLLFFWAVSHVYLHDDQLNYNVLHITNWAPGRYTITFHLNWFDPPFSLAMNWIDPYF